MKMPKQYLFDNDPPGEWLDDLSWVRHGLRNCPWEAVERFFPVHEGPGRPPHSREKLWGLLGAGAALKKVGLSETHKLLRNTKLARLIGYGPGDILPSRKTYTRFVQDVEAVRDAVNAVLERHARARQQEDERFGEHGSADTTAVRVHKPTEEEQERARKKKEERELRKERRDREDRNRMSLAEGWTHKERREKRAAKKAKKVGLEATEGVKSYDQGPTMSWWGLKAGVCWEDGTGLPLHVEIQTAKTSDHDFVDGILKGVGWLAAIQTLSLDRGFDSAENHQKVMAWEIDPVIDQRHFTNPERPADPRTPKPETVYDRERVTHLVNPKDGQWEELIFWGVDRKHGRLKYRCPCPRLRKEGKLGKEEACPFFGCACQANHGRLSYAIWVPIKANARYYCAIPRESRRWKKVYCGRTTSERGFSYTNDECGVKEMGKELKRPESAAGVFLQAVLATALMKLRKLEEAKGERTKRKRRTA